MASQFVEQIAAMLEHYKIEDSPHRVMLLDKIQELSEKEISLRDALVVLGPYMHAARNWRFQRN